MIDDDPIIDPEELRKANEACDAELRKLGIDPEDIHSIGRMGSAWKPQSLIRKGELTDRAIEKYRKLGYYSDEYREQRRQKMSQKTRRTGNYVQVGDNLIYCPK